MSLYNIHDVVTMEPVSVLGRIVTLSDFQRGFSQLDPNNVTRVACNDKARKQINEHDN